MRGFTLLELILVVGILAILGTVGFNFYFNFQIDVKVDEEINRLQQVLRQIQQKAVSGEEGAKWGIRFVNNTADDQHYDVFWGDSFSAGTSTDIYYLPSGVIFTTPSTSSTLDVIFNKRTGESASSSIVTIIIQAETSDVSKSVSITPKGLISR